MPSGARLRMNDNDDDDDDYIRDPAAAAAAARTNERIGGNARGGCRGRGKLATVYRKQRSPLPVAEASR